MDPRDKYDQLKSAAEAARSTLIQLEQERDELNKRLGELIEPINMLRNVVSAWESISGETSAQATLPDVPPMTTRRVLLLGPEGEPERAARGVVVHRVEQIMADGIPRSIKEVIVEIKRRFNVDENVNSVAMVLKRRALRGMYAREAGKFSLSL